jgi:hypothetical protein
VTFGDISMTVDAIAGVAARFIGERGAKNTAKWGS